MSSINLRSLEETRVNDYTYKDVHLDIKENSNISSFGLHRAPNTTDIEESRDEAAIRNSITNIFNTTPGEKLLNPSFGANLSRYLFSPMTKDTAENIGDAARFAVLHWEPRVRLIKVDVFMERSISQYTITLILQIPSLNNKKHVMSGRLTSNGYELI